MPTYCMIVTAPPVRVQVFGGLWPACQPVEVAQLQTARNTYHYINLVLLQLCQRETDENSYSFPSSGLVSTMKKMHILRWSCLAHCCDCLYGEYWFHLSRYVYDGNRSFASYTKTKSVESVV